MPLTVVVVTGPGHPALLQSGYLIRYIVEHWSRETVRFELTTTRATHREAIWRGSQRRPARMLLRTENPPSDVGRLPAKVIRYTSIAQVRRAPLVSEQRAARDHVRL